MHGWGGFSPDGRLVGLTANARDAAHADPCVITLPGGETRRLREVQGPHEWSAWYPDGRSLLLAYAPRAFESTLSIVSVETGEAIPATPGGEGWRHVMSSGVFRARETVFDPTKMPNRKAHIKILFYEDAPDATVTVEQGGGPGSPADLGIRINGKPDASNSGDLCTQLLIAHLPLPGARSCAGQ